MKRPLIKKYVNSSFIYLSIIVFLCSCNTLFSSGYNEYTVIVKFKPNSSLFKLIRKSVPTAISASLQIETTSKANPKLIKFFAEFGISSIKAVKPAADETPLPGGVERIFILRLKDTISHTIIGLLSISKDIEYAEHDFVGFQADWNQKSDLLSINRSLIVPNDPYFSEQWGLKNTGQYGGISGADINIEPAWNISTGDTGSIVAVLDSGIPLNSPDFAGRIIQGYDFVNNDPDPQDDEGHGTWVTGVIGATGNNDKLISGINWKCKILPLKIFNSYGNWFVSDGVSAIVYATDCQAKVINLSGYAFEFSQALQDVVLYAYNNNVIFVTAIGNYNNGVMVYPAGFSNVISVGAIDPRNKRALFSNYGRWLDFVAPGRSIVTLAYRDTSEATEAWGTSLATSFVSGVVSLMVGLRHDLIFQDV